MSYRPTSAQAFIENLASGFISDVQILVYRAIEANPHLTAREISKLPILSGYQIDSVRNRFAELEHAKVIKSGAARKDQATNKNAVTWTISNYVAVKGDFVVDKPRIFYGVKVLGKRGYFYENKKQAELALAEAKTTKPDVEFIKLREVRK